MLHERLIGKGLQHRAGEHLMYRDSKLVAQFDSGCADQNVLAGYDFRIELLVQRVNIGQLRQIANANAIIEVEFPGVWFAKPGHSGCQGRYRSSPKPLSIWKRADEAVGRRINVYRPDQNLVSKQRMGKCLAKGRDTCRVNLSLNKDREDHLPCMPLKGCSERLVGRIGGARAEIYIDSHRSRSSREQVIENLGVVISRPRPSGEFL